MVQRQSFGFIATLLTLTFGTFGLSAPAIAQHSPYRLANSNEISGVDISLGISKLEGESTEYVYAPSEQGRTVSRLDWYIDDVSLIGLDGSFKVTPEISLNLSGWTNLSDGDGRLDDYDWIENPTEWTDWSHHDYVRVKSAQIFEIGAGYHFFNSPEARLSLLTGYRHANFAWSAKGGSYIYSTDGGFRNSSGNFQGDAISYDQTYSGWYLGLGAQFNIASTFTLSARAILSPSVDTRVVDHHHLRSLYITSNFKGGEMRLFEVNGSVKVYPNTFLELGLLKQSYDLNKGDLTWIYYDTATAAVVENGGGIEHDSTIISTRVRFLF